jgi:hypothetical protein
MNSANCGKAWPYILAVVVMAILGVGAIVALALFRPNEDHTVVITLILGFLGPTTLSLLSFLKAQEAALMSGQTAKMVNGGLEQWKRDHAALNFAQGKAVGIALERAKVNE